jgi:RNA polymerase-binding transcription factor DksA
MPQKKAVKKIAKNPVKKVARSKKPVAKTVKKAVAPKVVSKSATKPNKKAAPKKEVKKTVHKPVVKPEKSNKKAVIHAPVKAVHTHEKHTQPMTKNTKHQEKHSNTTNKQVKKHEPVKEVKLPKISAKTSVPYQPSYKPMEQRQEAVKPNEPLVRYTDTELNEFRDLIQRKLDSAKKELGYLQGLITRKDDMGGDESENRYMTMEDGSISMEREQLSQMASRQITYIDHLEKALIRIENKTYGICRVTGKLIDKARLRAVPHATLSLEAKLGLVKAGE